MSLNINKYFTEADIRELKQIMLDIQSSNGVALREKAISLYNNDDAQPRDHKGKMIHVSDLASRAWTMAVLMHLQSRGYKIVKKEEV